MNTNSHEDRWTSFNDNWRQNASALLSRWCDPVMGGSPPGSAGVPPAQILPQLQPSPPPESTGSGALPLLRPGPCGSRRQGGRLQHRRETERQPKGQHAGGTPALPGVSSRWRGGGYPAGDFSESRPVPFGRLPFACEPGARPPRLGRSIEKDYKLNIDAQDNQDGRLLQETLTRAMIACGFEDVREHKPAVSGKILCILCIDVNQKSTHA